MGNILLGIIIGFISSQWLFYDFYVKGRIVKTEFNNLCSVLNNTTIIDVNIEEIPLRNGVEKLRLQVVFTNGDSIVKYSKWMDIRFSNIVLKYKMSKLIDVDQEKRIIYLPYEKMKNFLYYL